MRADLAVRQSESRDLGLRVDIQCVQRMLQLDRAGLHESLARPRGRFPVARFAVGDRHDPQIGLDRRKRRQAAAETEYLVVRMWRDEPDAVVLRGPRAYIDRVEPIDHGRSAPRTTAFIGADAVR